MSTKKSTVRRTKANKEAQSATPETLAAQANETFELAKLEEVAIVNVKKELAGELDSTLRGLGAYFTIIRKSRTPVLNFLIDLKKRGKRVNQKIAHEILNVGNFNLYREFLTDADRKRTHFTGNQALSILQRAVTKSDKQLVEMGHAEFTEKPIQ